MKPIAIALTLLATALSAPNVSAAPDPIRLERILTCQQPSSVDEIKALVIELGGGPIVSQSSANNVSYALPNPIFLYGLATQYIDVRAASDDMGEYLEYSARVSGASVAEIASFAEISRNEQGLYIRQIGNRDLSIRPEAGMIAVVCGNGVRSVAKHLRAVGRQISHAAEPTSYPGLQ